jgi:Protein of unknown function (DUF2934)
VQLQEGFMTERLVDVEKNVEKNGRVVLHTFPITIKEPAAETKEEAFKQKALDAAANAKLVPNEELGTLDAKIHVSRSGPLLQYGDPHGVLAETKEGLDQVVREHAYALWERAGRPEDRTDEFWHQAQHQRFCERAYALWEREGCPEGKADEHWYRIRSFEED